MASAGALLTKFLVVLTLASVTINVVHGCGINIRNGCGYSVTTCAQNQNNPISQFNLGPGKQQWLDFGSSCRWIAGTVWASVNGRCAAPSGPSAANDRNLANLAEFTIGDGSGNDFYDLSNVNAYTIPLSIRVTRRVGGSGEEGTLSDFRCGAPKCVINDVRGFCRGNNRLVTLPSGALSCVNTDGTSGRGPTDGTRIFKQACGDSYSYNFDDPTSTFTCGTGSDYEVTFCPGNGMFSDE